MYNSSDIYRMIDWFNVYHTAPLTGKGLRCLNLQRDNFWSCVCVSAVVKLLLWGSFYQQLMFSILNSSENRVKLKSGLSGSWRATDNKPPSIWSHGVVIKINKVLASAGGHDRCVCVLFCVSLCRWSFGWWQSAGDPVPPPPTEPDSISERRGDEQHWGRRRGVKMWFCDRVRAEIDRRENNRFCMSVMIPDSMLRVSAWVSNNAKSYVLYKLDTELLMCPQHVHTLSDSIPAWLTFVKINKMYDSIISILAFWLKHLLCLG